jgi:soluble lytic murein transglycosylase
LRTAFAAIALLWAQAGSMAPASDPAAIERRAQYRDALAAVQVGRTADFDRIASGLTDYVLFPYLDFARQQRNVRHLSAEAVTQFRTRWAESPLADRLYSDWLDALMSADDYRAFVAAFAPVVADGSDAARQCYYLRGLMRMDREEEAYAQVPRLWLVPFSQDRRCDAVFNTWIEAERLTEGMVWRRIGLALEANNRSLAEYLMRYLSGPRLTDAKNFVRVNRHPQAVTRVNQFDHDRPRVRTIVDHGLRRLARLDPEAAAEAWQYYEDHLSFEPGTARRIDQDITRLLARKGILTTAPDLSPSPDGRHLEVTEALVVAAIAQGENRRAIEWINAVDPHRETDPRWRYWLGRALLAEPGNADAGRAALSALAAERNYYGFLAAERLGSTPLLNASEPTVAPTARADLNAVQGFVRLRELYAIGDRINARREWRMIKDRLPADVKVAAVLELAAMGWMDAAVIAAGEAGMTDYLSVRFPQPYQKQYKSAAKANSLPVSLLYGLTRQESAFGVSAISSAGALGLMQLMPATAARTARAMGVKVPSRSQLLNADTNIRLGSRHLATVLDRYNGNRILATASYNAGEHRVDRWLRDRPYLAADLWVDMIPFLETRNYVKSVLAFSYVYSRLLGAPQPFLTVAERGPAFDVDQSQAVTSSALKGQSISRPSITSTGIRSPNRS